MEEMYNFAGICKYNLCVECFDKEHCGKCGWNSSNKELIEQRIAKAKEGEK